MSLGQDRVRLNFNPSENRRVSDLKLLAADFIDAVEKIRDDTREGAEDRGEIMRLCALAQTSAEEAAMWAVKAATMGK